MESENRARIEAHWSNRPAKLPSVIMPAEAAPSLRLDRTVHIPRDLLFLTDLFSIWQIIEDLIGE
jgi:hypothetical protein